MDTDARLPKPVAGDLRLLKAYVPPERWADVTERAKRAGLTVSGYLNALIDRDELDDTGTPVWAAARSSAQLPLAELNPAA
ncbi:hypothetical protein ACFFX1_11230 [Dactylosporangium sucinum]|uniref:Uncharacterized protein n=1 Tax=Dactylosporangium sucinum TaxID=1424081 RepID=A0A917WR25_9ACTN|nr:hypothetical protein [Dactylosporangium sucinum]GGM22280.1 hypothetical protein GCM10007977_024310 [Dactylosporangium sucinum]